MNVFPNIYVKTLMKMAPNVFTLLLSDEHRAYLVQALPWVPHKHDRLALVATAPGGGYPPSLGVGDEILRPTHGHTAEVAEPCRSPRQSIPGPVHLTHGPSGAVRLGSPCPSKTASDCWVIISLAWLWVLFSLRLLFVSFAYFPWKCQSFYDWSEGTLYIKKIHLLS